MRKHNFINNSIYHIYNRGVEKRKIFLDNNDYFRFVHDLFEFNDTEPAPLFFYKLSNLKSYEVEPHRVRKKRKLIVEILAFCLMPNHFHLLLRQATDGGIAKFMQKLGTGYAMYFNRKYDRTGTLFQGKFKSVPLKNESHFIHLPYYIHLNPLDMYMPEWRNKELHNHKKALNFLETYRWSSYLDYIGKKNFPSVTQREFLLDCMGERPEEYQKSFAKWLKECNLGSLEDVALEDLL